MKRRRYPIFWGIFFVARETICLEANDYLAYPLSFLGKERLG
jgi:hypothetical protein